MSFFQTDMIQVVEILHHVKRSYLVFIVGVMAADGLEMQGARASATMILTLLNQDNSVPAC